MNTVATTQAVELDKVDIDTTQLMTGTSADSMEQVVANTPAAPESGQVIEGTVSALGRARVYVNLPPFGTGLIYGREYMNARDILRKVAVGDTIAAKVVESENEDGYVELSLKEARQALIWGEAEELVKKQTIMLLTVKEANKGGLILDWQGIPGFLPASQLSADNYPRVSDGDKDRILSALGELVGKSLHVVMITADPKEQKIIFSEKSPQ